MLKLARLLICFAALMFLTCKLIFVTYVFLVLQFVIAFILCVARVCVAVRILDLKFELLGHDFSCLRSDLYLDWLMQRDFSSFH